MIVLQDKFKRGSYFELEVTLEEDDGTGTLVPVTIPVSDMSAQLRKDGVLLAQLDISSASAGVYTLSTDDDTAEWPLGVAFTDIRAEVGGKLRYSTTVAITIITQHTLEV